MGGGGVTRTCYSALLILDIVALRDTKSHSQTKKTMTLLDTQPNAAQPLTAGAVIASSSLPIIGDVLNYQLQKRQNQKAYEQNMEMWNKQNLYNNPTQQMERLKAAGLNPNLVYGNGATTTAGQGPTKLPAQPNINTGLDALSKLGQYQNIQLTKAQTDNVQAETGNKLTENTNKVLQQAILRKQAEKLGIDIEFLNAVNPDRALKIKQELFTEEQNTFGKTLENQKNYVLNPMQIQGESLRQANLQKDLTLKGKEIQLKGEDIKFRQSQTSGQQTENLIKGQNLIFETFKSQLAKFGVTTSDNWIVRKIALGLEKEGVDPESATGKQKINAFLEFMDKINPNDDKYDYLNSWKWNNYSTWPKR